MQNKVIPGAYINFVALSNVITSGSRGIAALPLELNWGEEEKIIVWMWAILARIPRKCLAMTPRQRNCF